MTIASALTEKAFASRRRKSWEELDAICLQAGSRGLTALASDDVARLPPLYRDACADLAAAEAARYSAPLVEYLRGLAASAHGVLYGPHAANAATGGGRRALGEWAVAFPRAVRKRWRSMTLSTALFFVPLAIGLLLTLRDPAFAFRLVPEAMLRPLAEAYAKGFDAGRDSGSNTMMAGFYVYNNVGIALRCFAVGIFGGLGSAFYLVQNGLSIGAIFGYVASQGAGANIGVFVVGHGSLELGAIVLSGGCGLSLGWSIVAPGELTRLASLQKTAREVLVIVAGAAIMLLGAAAIEGFWSGSSVPPSVKLPVGAALFLLVIGYILFAGRKGQKRSEA
jgi:uncharacterized membrane protein SpoIIM required for sporulation